MQQEFHGILINQTNLDIHHVAYACHVPTHWILERLQAGLLTADVHSDLNTARFDSNSLIRAQRMCAIERDFDANPELAALVVDLMEQVAALKSQLRCAL